MALPSNLTLQPAANDSVLDIACGTGIMARLARKRLGAPVKVIGVDVSAPMLAVGRGIDATIDWREGNTTALPVSAPAAAWWSSLEVLKRYTKDGTLTFALSTNVATARA